MDPSSNRAVYSAKARLLLQQLQLQKQRRDHILATMAPPPAYHTVVSPTSGTGVGTTSTASTTNSNGRPINPIPIRRPWELPSESERESEHDRDDDRDPDEEDEEGVEEEEDDDNDAPEVTINATTQVRGHGNIVTVPQLDSARIAGMLFCVLNGGPLSPAHLASQMAATSSQTQNPNASASANSNATSPPAAQTQAHAQSPQSHTQTFHNPVPGNQGPGKRHSKITITLNCGATVIGDRNIVGPGLGDIARHMQMQAQLRHQQQVQAANAQASVYAQMGRFQGVGHQHQGVTGCAVGPGGIPTPPMSRSSSGEGMKGVKRKAEGEIGDDGSKRREIKREA